MSTTRWRTYAALWARIDALALLRAPDFETVVRWRQEQERALRAQTRAADGSTPGIMDDEGVRRFVAFYERITRNLLAEREPRADLIVSLDAARHPVAMTVGSGTTGSGRTQ
jgi:D-glycerate 3-kinase